MKTIRILIALMCVISVMCAHATQSAEAETTTSTEVGGGGSTDGQAFPDKLPIGSFQMLKSAMLEKISTGVVSVWTEGASGSLNKTYGEFTFPKGSDTEVIGAHLKIAVTNLKLSVSPRNGSTVRVSSYGALYDPEGGGGDSFYAESVSSLPVDQLDDTTVMLNYEFRLRSFVNIYVGGGTTGAYLQIRNERGEVIEWRQMPIYDGWMQFPSAFAGKAEVILDKNYHEGGKWVQERRYYGTDGNVRPILPVMMASGNVGFKNTHRVHAGADPIAFDNTGGAINPYTLFVLKSQSAKEIRVNKLTAKNTSGQTVVQASRLAYRKVGTQNWTVENLNAFFLIEKGDYHFFFIFDNPDEFPDNDEVEIPPRDFEGKG